MKRFCLILSVFFPFMLWSMEIDYPTIIHKYRMQDGLSNDIVYDVCQDTDGCMWFGTAEGISKFDGSEFSSYNWSQGGAMMANHQAIKILYHEKRLYIANPFGLIIYNMEINKFKLVLPEGVNAMRIRALSLSRDGNLWVGSYDGGGVYKYNIKKESFEILQYSHTDNRIISLYEDKDNQLYIGTHFGGLDVVDLKTNKATNFSNEKNMQVEKITEDSFGNIWLGTWGGLMMYDKQDRQISSITNGYLENCQINALDEDKTGNLWVGTENGLIAFSIREACVNPHDFKMSIYSETLDKYGLSYKTVLDLHCDSDNNIWIATNSGGVNFISGFHSRFERIIYDPRLKNSLSYRRVTSISEDQTGNLWIATDGGGVDYYDKISKQITAINKSNSNLSDDAVLCSLVDSDGDVWLGTYNNKLNRKISGKRDFVVYEGSKSSQHNTLMQGDLLCLEEDAYNRIWIGQRSGLVFFDKKQDTFIQIPELKWVSIRCIFPTKDGVYIGAHPKVLFYDFVTKRLVSKHPGLDNLFANCLFVDEKEHLWIGTNGQGLFCYDPGNNTIKNFDITSGFPSDNVCKILQDSDKNLWITTNKGISKFSKTNSSIRNFNNKDGVQPGMFIENCGMKTRSGQIFFGGTEGITFFYPAEISGKLHHPNIIFTNFLLFNNPVEICSETNPHSPLHKTINFVSQITLDYKESVFSIEYASVDYQSANQINYAYILEGVDADWSYVKNKRTATYRYLAPGTYIFKVMSSNLDGLFDPSLCRQIKIIINPPFYLTWWAYFIYLLTFGVICYSVWSFLTVKTRALNRIRYERLERQKSEELHQEKLVFFTNISHELRTPLTLIAAPVDRLLEEETSDDKKYLLTLIKQNIVRLLNSINQIMDIRKIDRSQMKLKVEKLEIISFVGKIVGLFRDMAQSKQIELEYSHHKNELWGWIDPEFLDKILCNILSNAFKFTSDHGEVIINIYTTVDSEPQNNRLYIEITDTGKGIPADHLPYIFDRFYQVKTNKSGTGKTKGSGVGLHLVKSLVELHKGNVEVESKEGVGTKFILSFPFESENYMESEKNRETSYFSHAEQFFSLMAFPEPVQQVPEGTNKLQNKILVVDDDPEILHFLKFELCNDFEVFLAEDGRIALEKAYEIIPDLVISDVMMPELDGLTLCKELKTNIKTSHIPIILLTAKSTVEDKIEGIEVGADSYISKPFDIRHLRIRIKKLIELRETIRNKYVEKLSGLSPENVEQNPTIDDKLLQNIISFVKENISNSDINGETLAQYVAMSRMSLHRKLKALTGLSAGDFIRNIRLEEAKKLLEAGGRNVSEVSYDVGYSSPSYFYTCFVRKFGLSPSDVIKKG